MTPTPCLCKVDCGAPQGISPFLLLSAAAALIAFLVAIALAPKQRQSRVLQTQAETSQATSRSSSSSSSNEDNSNRDSNSDGDSGRRNTSPAQLWADVEIRLAAFRRDQEATLQEFRANNYRQRRLFSERSCLLYTSPSPRD